MTAALPHSPQVQDRSADAPLIYLVTGEHSGDNLAASLMATLREKLNGNVRFAGIGGPAMTKQGLSSLFPVHELALMGFAEVLPHLPNLFRRMRQTVDDIAEKKPAIIVTIDAPGFCLRLAKRVRPLGIPLVHYVAPQIWAWSPGRGKKLAPILDHIMALLPFEPEFFARYDVPCTYVGHPVLDSGAGKGDGDAFRTRHNVAADKTLIAVMPGSRSGEIRRMLPIIEKALTILAKKRSDLVAVVPTIGSVAAEVTAAMADWPIPAIPVTENADKHDGFAACRAAIAKSGTVNLELALAGLPMVVCYRVNLLTAVAAHFLISVPHVSLVNLLVGREIAPELLQFECRPAAVAAAILPLLEDGEARRAQIKGLAEVSGMLADISAPPGQMAADVVLDVMAGGKIEAVVQR